MGRLAVRFQFIIIIGLIIYLPVPANAQTKTITGYVQNKIGEPLQVEMTLNTPTKDSTTSAPDGSYTIKTEDFPTANKNLTKQGNIKIWPNPTKGKTNINLPTLKGTLEAYDQTGRLLDKANLEEDQELQFKGQGLVLLRYTNKGGEQTTKKLLIRQGNEQVRINAQNQQATRLKSGQEETFGYKITFNAKNIQDTTQTITGFNKNKTTHEQDFTLDELITKIKDIPDTTTTNNNITLNLKEYFKNDDETTYESDNEQITINGDEATINLTKGDVTATINAKEQGRNIQSNTLNIKKYHTITGKLTNIETDEPVSNAQLIAWDGKGNLTHTTTDEEGNYTLPSLGTNQIKIIKEGHQTRTTYNNTKNDTVINWNIYNKETFPVDAIKELTNDKTLRWISDPTIYIYKEEQYPQESYDAIEQLIKDVDGMSLGNTKNLEIKYITDISEYPGASKENPAISIRLIEGSNSGWNYSELHEGESFMYYAGIRIRQNEPKYIYTSTAEEFGSARLGCYRAINKTQIISQYHDDGTLNTREYQPVDSLATKYHFTRTNNAQVSTDTELNRTNMNELNTQEEITRIADYQNDEFTKEEYEGLPAIIRKEIEQ